MNEMQDNNLEQINARIVEGDLIRFQEVYEVIEQVKNSDCEEVVRACETILDKIMKIFPVDITDEFIEKKLDEGELIVDVNGSCKEIADTLILAQSRSRVNGCLYDTFTCDELRRIGKHLIAYADIEGDDED